jgi:hypothetical protein
VHHIPDAKSKISEWKKLGKNYTNENRLQSGGAKGALKIKRVSPTPYLQTHVNVFRNNK